MYHGMERLVHLMPPPVDVDEEIDWDGVARRWNRRFPSDFMHFANTYGAGTISNYLVIGSAEPLPPEADSATLEFFTPTADQLQPLESPFPAIPDPNGLIGWAANPDGDSVFWKTDPEPDQWKVVVLRRHFNYGESQWSIYDCGMVDFLVKTFDRTLLRNPFSGTDLWGADLPRFVHWKDE